MCAARKSVVKGPSWFEVGFGAFLAILLGAILGALYLITRPVTKAKDLPKDAPAGAVYFLEGIKDYNSSHAEQKRKAFAAGESVSIEEGDLNAFLATAVTSGGDTKAKPGDKAPPHTDNLIELSALNVRIRAGTIQFGDTVSYNIFGFTGDVIVQSTGSFSRHGSTIEFDPDKLLIGGLPLQNFPFLRGWALHKFLFASTPPEDLVASWNKLVDVSIEGNTLKLRMP